MKYTATLITLLSAVSVEANMPQAPPELTAADDTRVPNPHQCGFVYGDPHIFSWDGKAVDCRMGRGDFLYAKSDSTPFEIQIRHVVPPDDVNDAWEAQHNWRIGSGAEALVINTGVPGEPELEINTYTENATSWGHCTMKYSFDGVPTDLPHDTKIHGVDFERRTNYQKDIWTDNYYTYHFRNFYFEESGVFVQLTKSFWNKIGCFMNVRICIPDEIKAQGLYGMLGNADGNPEDDFRDLDGNIVTPTPRWGKRDDWCKANWCVADDASNKFSTPSMVDGCTAYSADPIDEAIRNASPLLKELCNNDPACMFDTLVSGDVDSGLRTLIDVQEKDLTPKVTEARELDEKEEDYCVTPEGEEIDCDLYEFEFKCEMIGYDFGFRMDDGCAPTTGGLFHDLTLTDQKPTCNVGGYNVGSYDMSCDASGMEATITPKVDGVVKISGSTTGMLYTGFKAGKTYTLTTGPGTKKEVIENIEFCFKCPTSIVDHDVVKCAADVFECEDGMEVARDPNNDCHFAECPAPEPKCTADIFECGDGTYVSRDPQNDCQFPSCPAPPPQERSFNAPPKQKGSSSGDPHFKTWTGEKYDYHGECDLVLIDDPDFNNGQGLKVHIRTTRVKYFSFIEKAAVQIGDDVLEFDNDVENFLINGEPVEKNEKHHKTYLGGFFVRRDKKALSIRLQDEGTAEARQAGHVAKIDLHTRKNGFPAVIIDAGATDIFKGSLGLLGEWGTGRKLARDGQTEFTDVDPLDAEDFALEWQVRDHEPLLFKESRFPQFPQTCTPAKKLVQTRLGFAKQVEEAEEACSHWKHDKEDCIFDVLATRDVLVAEEGHVVHVE